jgi:hypothetical protein
VPEQDPHRGRTLLAATARSASCTESDSAQPNQVREFRAAVDIEPDSAQPNQIHELRTATTPEKLANQIQRTNLVRPQFAATEPDSAQPNQIREL